MYFLSKCPRELVCSSKRTGIARNAMETTRELSTKTVLWHIVVQRLHSDMPTRVSYVRQEADCADRQ